MVDIDYERALAAGVCATLAEETFLSWIDADAEPDATYRPGDVGLFIGILPSTPDSAVMVSTYPVAQSPVPIIGVQFHIASEDPDVLSACVQAITDTFEGRWGGMLGSVRLVTALWQSGANLGQDANGRRGRTENYYLTIHRHLPNR